MAKQVSAGDWRSAVAGNRLLLMHFRDDRSTRSPAVQRKLRLLQCACLRARWPEVTDPRGRAAVEQAELFADGLLSVADLGSVWESARADGFIHTGPLPVSQPLARVAWSCHPQMSLYSTLDQLRFTPTHLKLVRDLFPHPLAVLVKVPKGWRTPTVLGLARGCYDTRDFGGLPVLADALEDAGCDSEPLLTHLRGPGPHVRGCWAVDAVLGL